MSEPKRFGEVLARRRSEHRLALLPYVMAGYRTADETLELMGAFAEAGADGFELGIPFSDPLADGPTVQRAGHAALVGGMTPAGVLDLLARARARLTIPVALMGYVNPIVRYGVDRFCRDAASAGASALIVPDVPPEEAAELGSAAEAAGLDLIQLIAPTTSPERIAMIARCSRGFIYCVSLTGVTGAREDLARGLDDLLARVRSATTTPIVVGFGISRPEHLTFLHGKADGAIVASVLIDALDRDGPSAAVALVQQFRRAADGVAEPSQ